MEIELKLELNEVNAVLEALGQLPTHTNTWPLAHKIREQATRQLPQQDQEARGNGDGASATN